MSEPRIIFAGGGGELDSRPLDEIFAGWVGPQGRVLYLPIALMKRTVMEDSQGWFRDTYGPLGLTRVDAWQSLTDRRAQDLARYDALYIGGGNTFYLLDQVRRSGLQTALADFIRAGQPAYGGSAGAILLSHDITSCAHIDPDVVGLTDLGGLNLALGYTIWCHYQPADSLRIKDYVRYSGNPSIAVSERAGVRREGPDLFAAGYEPAYVFSGVKKRRILPGEKIN
jgi:dipeptidase E